MTAKIYHNPRCSKSRQALQLLRHKEARFAELGLSRDDDRDDAAWVEILAASKACTSREVERDDYES